MQLSKHFSLEELIASDIAIRRALDNVPTPEIIENLKLLCVYLERVRELLGTPIIVRSGYRSPKVNAAVGGSAHSAHMQGLACDFIAPEFGNPHEVAQMIIESDIAFDQVIHEGQWVHFGIGDEMRKQALTAHFNGGKVSYEVGVT
jgi:zinc D-Ala-D-Ala carboxypeptidase